MATFLDKISSLSPESLSETRTRLGEDEEFKTKFKEQIDTLSDEEKGAARGLLFPASEALAPAENALPQVVEEPEPEELPSSLRVIASGLSKAKTDLGNLSDVMMAKYPVGTLDFSLTKGFTYKSPNDVYGPDFEELNDDDRRKRIVTVQNAAHKERYADVYAAELQDSTLAKISEIVGELASPTTLAPVGLAGTSAKALLSVGVTAGIWGGEMEMLKQLRNEGTIDWETVRNEAAITAVFAPALVVGGAGAMKTGRAVGSLLSAPAKGISPAGKDVADMTRGEAKGMWTQIRGEMAELWLRDPELLPKEIAGAVGKVDKADAISKYVLQAHPDVARNGVAFLKKAKKKTYPSMGLDTAKRGDVIAGEHRHLNWASRSFTYLTHNSRDRIRGLDEGVAGRVDEMDYNINRRSSESERDVETLDKAFASSGKPNDKEINWNDLQGGNWELAEARLRNNPDALAVLAKVRKGTEDMFEEMVDTGMIDAKSKILNYFPQMVRDKEGMWAAMSKPELDIMERTLKEKAAKSKTGELSLFEETEIRNQVLRSPQFKAAGGSTKQRKYVNGIPEEFREFYFEPRAALQNYMTKNIDEVEVRKFLGHKGYGVQTKKMDHTTMLDAKGSVTAKSIKGKLPEVAKDFTRVYKATSPKMGAKKLKQAKEAKGTKHERGKAYWADNVKYADDYRKLYGEGATIDYIDLPTKQIASKKGKTGQGKYLLSKSDLLRGNKYSGERGKFDVENSVGGIIASRKERGLAPFTKDQGNVLASLLMSRVGPARVAPAVEIATAKEIGYGLLLANPESTSKQFGDLGMSFLVNGVSYSVSAVTNRVGRGVLRKDQKTNVNVQQGISEATHEMTDKTAVTKYLNSVLGGNQFTRVDRFGKNVFIEAATERAASVYGKNGSVNGKEVARLYDKYANAYGDEWVGGLLSDLKAYKKTGETSDKMGLFGFAEINDVQPVSISNLPQGFQDHPNWRVMWMLQTWALKQIDVTRAKGINEIRNGNYAEGSKNLAKLAGFVGGMNAGIDIVGDVINGRDVDWDTGSAGLRLAEHIASTMYVGKHSVNRATDPVDFVANLFNQHPIVDIASTAAKYGVAAYQGDEEGKAKWGLESFRYVPYVGKAYVNRQKAPEFNLKQKAAKKKALEDERKGIVPFWYPNSKKINKERRDR